MLSTVFTLNSLSGPHSWRRPEKEIVALFAAPGSSGNGRMFVAHTKGLANNGTLDKSAAAYVTLNNGTYASGITATGSATQTCNLASFGSSCTGATATVPLTGTNTIASGTAMTVTNGGVGTCTGTAFSATASSGTATCSGTAAVDGVTSAP